MLYFTEIIMGIKGLSQFLKKTCPEIFEKTHISKYAYKRVAIDTSLYLCNFKAISGNRWISNFLSLVACLRKNDVHCVFVYDSGAPPEKENERKKRAESKERSAERLCDLEQAMEEYHESGKISDVLIEFQKKRGLEPKSLLSSHKPTLNVKGIEMTLEKMKEQLFSVTPEDFELTRKLFDILQVPYFSAPLEAETMCSDLCIQGLVDAVLTEDTDTLAYSSPIFLTKFVISTGECMEVKYDRVLESLDLTSEQFLDFCIMCGTDYNGNIFKVGPVKALKLIKEFGGIEGLEGIYDTSVLNFGRGRELFRDYEKFDKNRKIPYCGTPDFSVLQEFFTRKNIRISPETIKNSFVKNDLVFVDSVDETDD
jgi:5'-3' exonuclease